ncbi:MAG TPA: UDP-N-acetylmuramate dehydrogenase [Anaeromyxobacteraceae bacterium]|nr:UDP-N-acetylmuramate dehydrogenase [Anaeromyxobacteraceae bacterium]
MSDWREQIEREVRGEIQRDAPLAKRTSIRIGGPADLLVQPATQDDVVRVLRAAAARDIPVLPLGGGANLLVADRGVRGVTLRIPQDLGEEPVDGERLVLSAGAPASRLASRAQKLGLVGCEFAAGIPGTLGGMIAMNAGTRAGEMKDLVTRVEVATADGVRWIDAAALRFAYRHADLPAGAVVTRLEVRLRRGDVSESLAAMKADVDGRRARQPYSQPTFGSTFRNPPGDHAGRLVEAVGLKGHRIGGAVWSPVHANFVVNVGGATARDVLALVNLARARVLEQFGVTLQPEVRLAGEFAPDERIV